MYCVYLTVYKGNKLPPFYIGSSSTRKVLNGYHGSVQSRHFKKLWKTEIEQNPKLFKTTIIFTSDNRKLCYEKEELIQRNLNVIHNPLYINMCYANKNFDSTSLEVRLAISKSKKGVSLTSDQRKNLFKTRDSDKRGKYARSERTIQKISHIRKNSEVLKKCSISNLPKSTKGTLNGMHSSNRDYTSIEEQIRIQRIKTSKALRSKEQNIASYSRIKSQEEIKKLKEKFKTRHVIYVSRLSDRKIMDIGNFSKWCKLSSQSF